MPESVQNEFKIVEFSVFVASLMSEDERSDVALDEARGRMSRADELMISCMSFSLRLQLYLIVEYQRQ